ncbi:MAG TPA: hypothetical protein VL096_05720 [Pirellulaceae bacterium]|nr:hypothetical protein [Pirellulaceae bacterium]
MRLVHYRSLALGLLLSWNAQSDAAEPARLPMESRAANEARLLRDGADGRFDDCSLLRAALVASQVSAPTDFQKYEEKFNGWVVTLRRATINDRSSRDRAVTTLSLLHREVLIGEYDAGCSDLSATFETGRYNCITATILYWSLLESLQMQPIAVHLPGHVRMRIDAAESVEIETTSSSGVSSASAALTMNRGREIAAAPLVGKLYYNRGLQALTAKDFTEAVQAFEHSLTLDPLDTDARHNLLAALNNGALALCERGEYPAANAQLARAATLDPHYPLLAMNELHLRQRWVVTLCEQKQFEQALETLLAGAVRQPQAELFRSGQVAVYRLWAAELARRGERHAALAKLEQAIALAPQDQELARWHATLAGQR